MTRFCVSIPAHEQLPIVIDQIENLRAFLPDDTMIVFHFASGFSDPTRVQAMLGDGVYVNPVSLQTEWGNIMNQHHLNYLFAKTRGQFDYFVMHASNDLYIRPGAGDYMATADAGIQRTPLHPFIEKCDVNGVEQKSNPRDVVCNYAPLWKMVSDLGIDNVVHSQPEGMFFREELFGEMIEIIEKYWQPGPDSLIGPEHVFYPTVAAKLTNSFALPTVYSDALRHYRRHPITPELIHALRSGTYIENHAEDLANEFGGDAATYQGIEQYDFQNIYGIKRAPREYDHPIRLVLRTLARQVAPRLRLRLPEELPAFSVLSHIDELLTTPSMLRDFAAQFSATDDAGLVVFIPEHSADRIPALEAAVEDAGLNATNGAEIIGLLLQDDEETAVAFSRSVDVHFTDADPTGLMADTLHVRPSSAYRLGLLAKAATSSGVPRGTTEPYGKQLL